MKKIFLIAIAMIIFSAMVFSHSEDTGMAPNNNIQPLEINNREVVIYKNEACGHCNVYLKEFRNFLYLHGYANVEEKLMINNPAIRQEVALLHNERNVPLEMQGHMIVTIDNSLILEGHVPIPILENLFEEYNEKPFPKMIIYQDFMLPLEDLESYKIMDEQGEIRECEIKDDILECSELDGKIMSKDALLPLVIFTGLIDGINPCAFGVLLFFIAFLYTMRRSKMEIYKVGFVFIFMIFLTYLLIGLGLLQAILISGVPHLFGKISAVLMLLLALVNIKDYFFYGKWFSLKIPSFAAPIIKERMNDMTLAGVIILGFLVGLCTFPCSGGIYVGILSLMAIQTTFIEGLGLLLLYNAMFVVPLIIILLVASNEKVADKLNDWEKNNKKNMKLASGIVMLILAAILWFFSF
ncbi:MAG: cytochrome c biogenesis protein CcdA [Candidatus Diapherotrites archaeon]